VPQDALRYRYARASHHHFLCLFKTAPPQTPPPKAKILKRKWLVACSPLRPSKNFIQISIYLKAFHVAFLRPRGARGVPRSSVVGISTNAHTPPAPRIGRSHSFAWPARSLCSSYRILPDNFTPNIFTKNHPYTLRKNQISISAVLYINPWHYYICFRNPHILHCSATYLWGKVSKGNHFKI